MIGRWLVRAASLISVCVVVAMVVALAEPQQTYTDDTSIVAVSVCAARPGADIEAITSGTCTFVDASAPESQSRGFARSAFWLRILVENHLPSPVERWLRIGHPRLQNVSLYAPAEGGGWVRQRSGLFVPMAERPLLAAEPLFPVLLPAGGTTTVYVEVRSETAIDLTPSLWQPDAYRSWIGNVRLFQAVTYGALAFSAFLTLALFGRIREPVYLYFAICQIFAGLMDASYTGFLAVTVWPPTLVFDIRLQSLASGMTGLFLALFLSAFLPHVRGDRPLRMALRAMILITGIVTLAAITIDYSLAVPAQSITGIGLALLGALLAGFVYSRGGRPSGFLILPFLLLAVMMIYRQALALGLLAGNQMQAVGFGWCFLLIGPGLLTGVMERSEALRRAAGEARSEALARLRLTAEMSHELRAPLNTIFGFARLMRGGSARATSAEAASAIESESRRLLTMVDELLDFARGEVGQLVLTPGPVLLAPFFEEVRRSAELTAAERGNRFVMTLAQDLPTAAIIDAARLRQVLDNLIGNAAHYTDRGEVDLAVTVAEPPDGVMPGLRFDVTDSGIGLPKGEEDTIFEPFRRGRDASARAPKGAGIGLALSRQLVGLMGGQISARNRTGGGSRFTFTVSAPVASAAEIASLTAESGQRQEGLVPPNAQVLSGLVPLIEAGAVTDIEAWLASFAAAYPDQRAYRAALSDALNRLDFPELRRLAEPPQT